MSIVIRKFWRVSIDKPSKCGYVVKKKGYNGIELKQPLCSLSLENSEFPSVVMFIVITHKRWRVY